MVEDKASAAMRKIALASGEADGKLDGVKRQMKAASVEARASEGAFSSLGGVLKGALLTAGIGGLITKTIQLGASAEQTRVSYETMLGSSSKAASLIAEINQFANATPFKNADIDKNAKLLLNFGFAQEKVLPTLKMLGDVSGGNVEKFDALSLAFAQVSSAGKLQGQDLLQMINAGFNPLQEISKKTGISMGELKDQMSKGAISAKMVEGAFQSATGPGGLFYKMMEKQSQTIGGKWSTFMGNAELLLTKIGIAIQPVLHQLLDFGIVLLDNTELLQDIAWGVGTVIAVILTYKATVMAVAFAQAAYNAVMVISQGVTALFTGGFAALNAVMMLNPIGLVVAAVVALAAGFIYAYNNMTGFRSAFHGIWEAAKTSFTNIGNFFKKIFGPIFEAIEKVKKGDYSGAAKSAAIGLANVATLPVQLGVALAKGELTKGVATAYANGKEYGKNAAPIGMPSFLKKFTETAGEPPKATGETAVVGAGMNFGLDLAKNTKTKSHSGEERSSGGSGSGKNIVINMTNSLTISTANLRESSEQIYSEIKESIARAVNGATVALG
jgi:tape measure domain-containing protein